MNPRRAAQVIDVLRAPRMFIPTEQDYGASHEPWLAKTEHGLITGERHALLAQDGQYMAGAEVFRLDSDDPSIVDARNISVNPDYRGRFFGAFLVRNVEHLAILMYPEVTTMRVDTKLTNEDMLSFLERQGYVQQALADLYGSGKMDVILYKTVQH